MIDRFTSKARDAIGLAVEVAALRRTPASS